MSKEKFTQGEWKVDDVGLTGDMFDVVFNDDGECVAEIVHTEADAQLIAAAPEMYRELERDLNDQLKAQKAIEGKLVDEWLNNGIKRKQKILAKARGEHDT